MKLLKLNFEQSKKLVGKRKDIIFDDKEEKKNMGIMNRIFYILITGGFIIFMAAFGLGPATDPVDTHGEILISHDTAMITQLTSMYLYGPISLILKVLGVYTVVYCLIPFPSMLIQRVLGIPFCLLLYFSLWLSLFPFLFGMAVGNDGNIVTIIWSILLLLSLIYVLEDYYRKKISIVTGKPKKELHLPKIFSIKNAFLICIAISIVEKASMVGHGHLNFVGIIIGFIYPLANILFIFLGTLILDMVLKWYYIAKYPLQYRVYFKIPDNVWYYSEQRAAKHRPVYPLVRKKEQAR